METIKLSANDIEKYNKEFRLLLEQSFKLSFPNESINYSLISQRIEQLQQYIRSEKAIVYGSIIKEKLIGFIWFFVKDSINRIHINQIVIDENGRNEGIGTALINKVELYANERNIKEIELIVTKKNYNAVKFYESKDFEVERLFMRKRLLE